MEIVDADVWVLLLSTVRYSMGRQSYMPSVAAEMVIRYQQALSLANLEQIRSEVLTELVRCEQLGRFLGSESDHKDWKKLTEDIRDVIALRVDGHGGDLRT